MTRDFPKDPREAAALYLDMGLAVVPLPTQSKSPAFDGWRDLRLTPEDLGRHFPAGEPRNIGVLNGVPSGNVLDVDLDCPEAVAAAPMLLPPTGRVFGRPGSPGSHREYVTDVALCKASDKFLDPCATGTRAVLLELRGTGGLTVYPPGLHKETGEPIRWESFSAAGRVSLADLRKAASELAACALLARHWPARGSRHEASLALAGGLLRSGLSPERAEVFVEAVAIAGGDEEARSRAANVSGTHAKLLTGDAVTGWPALKGRLGSVGDEVVACVRRWLGSPPDAAPPLQPPDGPRRFAVGDLVSPADRNNFGRVVALKPGGLYAVHFVSPDGDEAVVDFLESDLTLASGGAKGKDKVRPSKRPRPLPPYVPFPVEALPGPVADFVREGAAALGCDPAYLALPALSAVASAIGNARAIRLKVGWEEPSIVWTVVVGDSGTLKSPAFQKAVSHLYRLQKELLDRFKAEQALFDEAEREFKDAERAAKKTGESPGEPPPRPVLMRLVVGDTTIEKLAEVLDDNPRGVLVARDELAGWLGSFARYKAKGGSDLPNWLEMHRAGTVIVDRKTTERKTLFVHRAAVCVAGGIQPGALAKAMTADLLDSGLAARLLPAMPPRSAKSWSEAESSPAVEAAFHGLLDRLLALEPDGEDGRRPRVVALSPEAKEAWVAFYNAWGKEQAAVEGELAAAFSKLEGYAARFTLLHHVCATVATGEGDLAPASLASVEAGVALCRWFAGEARRIYSTLSESKEERDARRLLEFVLARGGKVTARELMRGNCRLYPDAESAKAALDALVAAGAGSWSERAGKKRGKAVAVFEACRTHDTLDDGGPDEACMTHDTHDTLVGNGSGDSCMTHDTHDTVAGGGPPRGANVHDTVGPAKSRMTHDTHDTVAPVGLFPRETGRPDGENTPFSLSGDDRVMRVMRHAPEEGDDPRDAIDPGLNDRVMRVMRHAQDEDTGTDPGPERPGERVMRPGKPTDDSTAFRPVTDAAGLEAVRTAIQGTAVVGLDTETTGLDPRAHRVRLLALACDTTDGGTFCYLVDCFAVDPSPLWDALAEADNVLHNAAFDLGFLAAMGFVPSNAVHCTMTLSRLLHAGAGKSMRHTLAACAERELGLSLPKELQRSDWSAGLTEAQLEYAARDAAVLPALLKTLKQKVAEAKLERAAEVETRCLPAMAWLSSSGVAVDAAAWGALAAGPAADASRLRGEMAAMSPVRPGELFAAWNYDSPADVKALFAALGHGLASTDDEALAAVGHPLAAKMREYRDASKRLGTYGGKWLRHVAPDGRVYASWNQTGADSGRMSCGDPNMQNLPRDPAYRRCVAAPPGRVLVKADYSQIELRIAAKVTKDQALLDAYNRGEDLHALTARRVLGVERVSKDDRQLAKALNFGLLYGMGAERFRGYAKVKYGLELSPEAAAGYRSAFFKAYPGLAAWHRKTGRVKAAVETRTLSGRRRLGVSRFTEKLNTPVQGTGADGIKVALALLWERREQAPGAFPVLAVHDEVVVECDADKADAVSAWLKAAMLDAMSPLIAPVPVEVEVRVARTWVGD